MAAFVPPMHLVFPLAVPDSHGNLTDCFAVGHAFIQRFARTQSADTTTQRFATEEHVHPIATAYWDSIANNLLLFVILAP